MRSRTHQLSVPGAVPGVVPRLAVVALVSVGAFALLPFPLWQGAAVVLACVAVIAPRTSAAWVGAASLPLGVLVGEPDLARTALALLLVHAIHVLASVSLVVPLRSRLRVRALLPALRRFAVVQLVAQPLAFGVQILAGGSLVESLGGANAGLGWLAPVAAAALLLGVILMLRAAVRADADASRRTAAESTAA
ncbi:hypothetical protein [Streptomyces sp. AC495_CC817]|uniref:hypothetical protein n=1 Tax=Streptomyces sp. AC495_CC817 TaxID=2823900 RepID=UPI001C25C144|nr:hypothetical protein [Streptomyces sp. AC495_CC817]